jgi:adenylate cyclase
MVEDLDGIFRQYQLVANMDTLYFGSLALSAYESYTGRPSQVIIKHDGTGEIKINDKQLEINGRGETKVRFIGASEQFDNIPLFDLISAKDSDQKMKERIQGKIIFVGSTAVGAHDLRPTALDSKMPGVYVHMNVAHMLLHEYFFKPIDDSLKYSAIMLLVGTIILLIIQYFSNAYLDLFSTMAMILATYYADSIYFLPNGYEMKLFYCYFSFVGCYSWSTFLNFSEASKEKKQIKGTFARYVAPTIVDEMLKEPDKLKVGGQKMDITCLFSDVRDFTSISEQLSATELAQSLNRYMGAMTDVVFDTQGTLDKYIGDAIVAFWGAPLPLDNHAQFAVEGAIKMIDLLPAINEEFKSQGRPEFKIGIGLNSGECSVGFRENFLLHRSW